jgi:hypothetical protein
VWGFFQSGLFAYIGGIHEDWAERSERWQPPQSPSPLSGSQDAVARFTEAYGFAARLASTPAGDDRMHVSIGLRQVAGRQSYMENPARHLMQVYRTEARELIFPEEVERDALLADPRLRARNAMRDSFLRFGFDVHDTVLTDLQAQL